MKRNQCVANGSTSFEHVSIHRVREGAHRIDVHVNGIVLGSVEIEVADATPMNPRSADDGRQALRSSGSQADVRKSLTSRNFSVTTGALSLSNLAGWERPARTGASEMRC